MNSVLRTSLLCGAVLAICACSREPEQAVQAPAADTNPLSAESWIDAVQLKGTQGAESARAGFAPGEVIELSMTVNDAPAGTNVTAYWYGPDGRQLAYETKTVAPDQQTLIFLQNNTFDWTSGDYRAEVWVGDAKVEEESFRVAAG